MPGSLLILTGPPGAGKSTGARMVAAGASRPSVHLDTDSFYVWIRTGLVPPYLPEAAWQNDVVLGGIAEAAYVVLRPSLEVTLARGTARDASELTDVEPLKGMHAAFAGLGALEQHVMDTTGQSAEETADAVRSRARSAVFAL
ncbi:hypothetical protein [Amycolatopsis sp. lyj-346]|uniref:hypothetical protein n=1 Tax=Amycolatopsis sp. lyj-346 TaxID=2789289 RepID=UPI00397C3F71